MFRATKEFKWDMAHRLPDHEGKCFNVHGHTYKALITIKGETVQAEGAERGMLKDFGNFKPLKERIDENWDHAYVGVVDDGVLKFLQESGFKVYEMINNPTAENMAELLFLEAKKLLGGMVEKVVVYETPTSFAEYSE